jgi:hypothetical protein
VKHGRALRGETLMGGGRGRMPSRRQPWLRADESGMDVLPGGHRIGPEYVGAIQSRGGGIFRYRLQAVDFEVAAGRDEIANTGSGLEQKLSPGAPRNAPLRTGRKPGAETALFLYHPYFSGAQRPDGQWI